MKLLLSNTQLTHSYKFHLLPTRAMIPLPSRTSYVDLEERQNYRELSCNIKI